MKFFARKQNQRVTNFALAAMLFVSTITASVPFLFNQTASAVSSAVYVGLPSVQPSTYPSIGFAATSTKELGDRVTLAGSNRHLDNVTVSLTSWACEFGEWNLNNCMTTDGATFQQSVTANLYAVGAGGTVGALIATKTQTINAQYRPTADPTCGTGLDAGRWRAPNNLCYNGKAFDVNFDFSAQHKTLPDEVIATVAYDGQASASARALNVSLATTDPTVGQDYDTNMYEDTTYGGTPAGLAAGDYTGYHGAFNITASPANVAPTVTFNAPTPANDSYIHGTVDGNVTFTDDYGMGGYAVRFWKDVYEVANGGTLVKDCSSYPGAYNLGTSVNATCSLDVSSYPDGTKFFLSAQVLDGDNVWSSDVRSYTVDNTAPTLYVKQGANLVAPSSTTGVFNTVDFKLYDNTLVDKVTINGVTKDVSDAQWSDVNGVTAGQLGAVEGSNTIVLYDAAGNTTSYTFTIDTTAPIGTLSYSPSTLTNQSVVATLETNEPIQLSALTGTWNQVTTTKFTKVFPVNATQAQTLKDAVGNTGSVTVTINWIDKTAPAAPVITNSPITINSSMDNAQATWSHNEVDVDHYEYREYMSVAAANADADGNTASYWIVNHPANEKTQTVGDSWTGEQTLYYRVVAVDAAGNRSAPSALGTVVIDKVAPAAPVFAVKVGSTTLASGSSTNSYLFDQVWNIPTGNPVSYQYRYWNAIEGNQYKVGSEYIVNTPNTNIPAEFNQGEGVHYMQVRAFDAAGNPSAWSSLYTITFDETEPTATVSYAPSTATNGDVTVTLTASEALDASTLSGWTQVSDSVYTKVYTENTTEVVTFKDAAGNDGSTEVSINWIDKIDPSVTITVPATTLVADNTPTINGTYNNNQELATDDTTIVVFIDGSETPTDGTLVKNANGTWSFTPTATLAQGSHTFVAVATDAVGNVSEASNTLTLTIDTVAPAVTVVAVTSEGDTPTITGTAELGATLTVTFNGVTSTIANTAGNWTFTSPTALANGEYLFSITARDAALNGTTATSNVTVSVTPAPGFTVSPPIISPAAAAVLGASTENNDGAANVAGATDDKTAAAVNSDANQGKIFGLAWYWWILILAALAAIGWFIAAAIRRRNEEQA